MSSLEIHEVEARLHHAYAEKADSIEPALDAWEQTQRRIAYRARRRSHRRAYGAVAVAAAFAAVIGTVALSHHPRAKLDVAGPAGTERPTVAPTADLCVTQTGLTPTKVPTNVVSALVECPTFKHGNATMTVGTKSYRLDELLTNDPGMPWYLVWDRAGGDSGFEIVRFLDGTLRGPQLFEIDGHRVDDGGCSTNISKFDATALKGTFKCPKFSVDGSKTTNAAGSFSATP